MKVLIFTSGKNDLSKFAAEFRVIDWENANFALNINFADYDGLIVDADSLTKLRESQDEPVYIFNLEAQLSPAIITDIASRRGSFVTIIGNPLTKINNRSVAFLLGFDIEVKALVGTSILENAGSQKFSNYWKKVTSYDYYIESIASRDYAPNPFKNYRLCTSDSIKNRSNYILGCRLEMINTRTGLPALEGDVSFVPSLKDKKQETFDSILELYVPYSQQTEPEWLQSVKVAGQEDMEGKIAAIKSKIEKLSTKKNSLEDDIRGLRRPLEVLYKSDKPLEESIKNLMTKIGFTVEEPGSKNKVEFIVKCAKRNIVVEVKSTKKETIDMKGLRQVINWQMDELAKSGRVCKPLLIVSNQYDKPLEERSEDFLPPNLVDFAKQYKICAISVKTLFEIARQINAKQYSYEEFAKRIEETDGILSYSSES